MRYVRMDEVIELHRRLIVQSGGADGLRDAGVLASALAQPQMTFDGEDLYSSLSEKAAALGFSLISNHPFVDGNKRVGQATMELFLFFNGYEIEATVDEQERIILDVASGKIVRTTLSEWLNNHLRKVIAS